MNTSLVFIAVLVHDEDPDRDYAIEVPSSRNVPPNRLRIPTSFAGAAAFDVYELADASDWPAEATFHHAGLVPRTTPDMAGHSIPG